MILSRLAGGPCLRDPSVGCGVTKAEAGVVGVGAPSGMLELVDEDGSDEEVAGIAAPPPNKK